MEHRAGAKFHGFHGDNSMLSRKTVRTFPIKPWEAWDIKPWKAIERMGIYKNESMESTGSMVFCGILLSITSGKSKRKHGI